MSVTAIHLRAAFPWVGLAVLAFGSLSAAAEDRNSPIRATATPRRARRVEFRHVMIIHRSYDIPGYRVGTIPDEEIAGIREAFEITLPRMIADWSEGQVVWKNRVIVSERILRSTGGGSNPAQGGGEWVTAYDIQDSLRDHVDWAEYDCIYVYLGYPMNSAAGYGGGGPLGAGLVTTGQFLGDALAYNSESLGGLFHEWCHAVAEDFYRDTLAVPDVPGIHHDVPDPTWIPDDYGYGSGGKAHWLNWYINYLRGTVRTRNGRIWGLGKRCWREGTRRDYYAPRRRRRNLIQQPSFEEVSLRSWSVRSWRNNPSAGGVSETDGRTGRRAGFIQVRDQDDDAALVQTITVKPFTQYHLSGWIRTEEVQVIQADGRIGANFSVLGGWEHSDFLVGNHGWTRVHLVFYTGARTEITVCARLGFYGSTSVGTAWFDDVKLIQLSTGNQSTTQAPTASHEPVLCPNSLKAPGE